MTETEKKFIVKALQDGAKALDDVAISDDVEPNDCIRIAERLRVVEVMLADILTAPATVIET